MSCRILLTQRLQRSATYLDLAMDVKREHACTTLVLFLCTSASQPRLLRVVRAACASTAQAHFNAGHHVGGPSLAKTAVQDVSTLSI